MEQPIQRHTFRKEERLCSKSAIEKLFITGQSFYVSPIKILLATSPINSSTAVKVLITVPKKYLRQANERNRMKRLIREAYRRKKHILTQTESLTESEISIAFIFTGRHLIDYSIAENIIERLLEQALKLLKTGNDNK
jgi:ribonuclease P protein component